MHKSIGKALFEVVERGKKVPTILHTKNTIFEANKYTDWEEAYKKVKIALEKIWEKQKKAAYCQRCPVDLGIGNWVSLCFENQGSRRCWGKSACAKSGVSNITILFR